MSGPMPRWQESGSQDWSSAKIRLAGTTAWNRGLYLRLCCSMDGHWSGWLGGVLVMGGKKVTLDEAKQMALVAAKAYLEEAFAKASAAMV